MRKLYLILSFLLVLLVNNNTTAQTVFITTGTAGTPAYNAGPVYRSSAASAFDASRYTYLYTASELAAAGISAGSVINLVGWVKNNTATSLGVGGIFRIYMKNTSAASFSLASETWANLNTGATMVYENLTQTIPATATPTYIDFPLTTSFTYTGGSLEISTEWDINQVAGNASTGTFDWLWSTVVDRIYGTGNTTLAPITTLSSTTNSISTIDDRRPFIKITYTGGTTGIDLGAQSLVAPAVSANGCYTSAETVTIRIRNYSTNPHNFSANPVTVTTNVTGAATQTLSAVVNTGTLAAAGTLDVPMSTTLNMSATGVYTFNASTAVTGDVTPANDGMPSVNITKAVLAAGTASASPNQYCVTPGAPTLSTAGATGYGNLQWQQSTTPATGFTDIPGATTTPYTLGSPIAQTMYYRLVASCNGNNVISNEVIVTLNNPQVTGTTPGAACGPGPVAVTLGATGTGAILNWYAAASGGLPIGTGTSFTTPPISANTTYYVASGSGGGSSNLGLPAQLAGTSGAGTTNFGLVFDALSPFTLNTVVVYPIAAAAGTAGTVTIDVVNSAGAVLNTATVNVVGNPVASATAQTVTLNFAVATGTNLKLRPGARSAGITGLLFEPSATAPPGGNYGYPFVLPGVVSINHSTLTAPPANTPRLDLYYYFYNWSISTGCESARTAVLASIVSPPSATIAYSGSPYCSNGGTATVTRTGTAGGTYSSTAGLTINPATGDVTLGTSTPGTYTVTYSISGPCPLFTTTAQITITGAPNATISYSGSPYCNNAGTATVTRTGTAGGTYSSTAGLTINSTTGDVTLGTSTPGTYTVTYTIAAAGGCPLYTTTSSITINNCTFSTSDLGISKTDGTPTYIPGTTTTYTIVVANTGPGASNGATVTDNFPAAIISVTWTAAYTGGATGPASGSGNINATVNLPVGSTATFTAVCNISAGATGGLFNIATVSSPAGDVDPNSENNSAADFDTPNLQGDLGITKTDGVTTYTAGGTTTYVITASNSGPGDVIGANVIDNFPAAITGVTWTVVYVGGATGPASGSGNIDVSVNIPAGGSATFTAVCSISASATGNLVNTATIAAPQGTTDPNPGNNSATDTDTPGGAPTITVTGTLTAFTSCSGSPSAEQTFTVSGTFLTANIVITAPAGFEVSVTSGSGFSGTISLIPAGGNVSTTTIYVRLTAAASGTPSGNITAASTGATTRNVAVSGTVNPIPTVNPVSNQTLCNGSSTTAVTFSGSVPGTVYNWTNSAPSIGLAATGSGNIASFVATNGGATVITANIVVTPVYTNGVSCTGTPVTFTITVNPTPTVNAISNQVVCNNAATTPISFTGAVAGTIYSWTNNTPSIGLPASGTGNIPSFIATNSGGAPVTATITVTPTTNSASFSQTYTYTGAVQTLVVPAGVTSVNIQAFGAQGNNNAAGVVRGGLGGLASGTLAVTPGETLWIYVGGGGATSATGGFNGGGNGGTTGTCVTAPGGGGGGASDVRQVANTLANRRIVAGGGGGTAGNRVAACARGAGGGGGGGYYGGGGGSGYPGTAGVVPTGGTQAAGGAGGITGTTFGATNGSPGALGIGGAGGNETASNQAATLAVAFNAGNGGGLIGANGTQSGANDFTGQSGAGGSSYIGGVTGGITSSGVQSGNGQVIISYTLPVTPVICTGTPRTFTITVNPSPTLTCPANVTVTSTPGQCGAIVNYPPATAGGSPAPTVTYSNPSGSFFPAGVTTVTVTATNTCGSTVCTFTVTVLDNVPPTVTCPANITTPNTPNLCSAVVTYNFPSFNDNCQLFQAPAVILPHGAGAITVAGNTLPGGFYFDLRNTTATPKLISSFDVRFGSTTFGAVPSPAPVSVFVTTSATTYVGNQTNAAAWTTIGADIPVTVAGPNSEFSTVTLPGGGFILPPNTTRGIYLFGTASSLVYNDATNSNFNPISNGVLTFTPGQASSALFVAALSPRVPNVRIKYITLSQTGPASGSTFPVGTTPVAFTVTDDGGNSANCSFNVIVNDTQAPTVSCPGNITVTTPVGSCTAVVTYTVTGADNCPGVTTQLVSGPASGSAFPIGTTTVTWRAVDAAGNVSANCSFNVTVIDAQAPSITAQPANRTVCLGTTAVFSVTAVNGVTYQWQAWNGTTWVDIAGAATASYTINNVTHAMNTNSFRVRVNGLCSFLISNHATLYVNALPFITITPNVPQQLLPGQTITLTANGTPGGGSYQWFKNNVAIPGATGGSLGPLSVLDAGAYKVVYTDPNGCVNTSADVIVSAIISGGVWIYPNPNSGQFHVRYYNAPNEEATITVYNYLGAIVYQKKHTTGALPYGIVDVDLGDRLAIGTYIVDVRNSQGLRIGAKLISVGRQ